MSEFKEVEIKRLVKNNFTCKYSSSTNRDQKEKIFFFASYLSCLKVQINNTVSHPRAPTSDLQVVHNIVSFTNQGCSYKYRSHQILTF